MIIYDHHQKGYSHSQVNAGIIYFFSKCYPDETIYLFLEKEHYVTIMNLLADNNIVLKNLVYIEIDTRWDLNYEYKRFKIDFNLVRTIFNFARKNKQEKIISLYTSVWQLYSTKLFCLFNPNISYFTVVHSELERIKISQYFGDWKRFFYHLFFGIKIPLQLPSPKKLKYIVLGESIKNNLLKRLPKLSDSLTSIDHPYFYEKEIQHLPDPSEVNFGIFGMVSKRKNGDFFLKLFDKLSHLQLKNFKFSLIGHIKTESIVDQLVSYSFLEFPTAEKKFIDKETFNKLAQTVDYSVYFYKKGTYDLTASGAFWDSISYIKPIIALKNDYFEYYFNKFGNIGYLFDTYEEMEAKIIEIINNFPKEEYDLQVENIKKVRNLNIFEFSINKLS